MPLISSPTPLHPSLFSLPSSSIGSCGGGGGGGGGQEGCLTVKLPPSSVPPSLLLPFAAALPIARDRHNGIRQLGPKYPTTDLQRNPLSCNLSAGEKKEGERGSVEKTEVHWRDVILHWFDGSTALFGKCHHDSIMSPIRIYRGEGEGLACSASGTNEPSCSDRLIVARLFCPQYPDSITCDLSSNSGGAVVLHHNNYAKAKKLCL